MPCVNCRTREAVNDAPLCAECAVYAESTAQATAAGLLRMAADTLDAGDEAGAREPLDVAMSIINREGCYAG